MELSIEVVDDVFFGEVVDEFMSVVGDCVDFGFLDYEVDFVEDCEFLNKVDLRYDGE